MSSVIQVLRAVRELLADPRRWVQGYWAAYRDGHGVLHAATSWRASFHQVNCFCLGEAISRSLVKLDVGAEFTVLRSDVEMQLLNTLGERGIWVPAVHQWNDAPATAYHDVLELLDRTLERLAA